MKSSFLILTASILFILCAMAISFRVERQLDPDLGKDWFAIGFVSPADAAPDFVMMNHSADTAFRYTIRSGGKTLSEETFTMGRGETRMIHPDNTALPKPYTLSVFPENDPKRSESLTRK